MLNAFRHQRKKRNRWRSALNMSVSNAQRLPASKEETLPAILDRFEVVVCSTPSGIKGRNAWSSVPC